MEHTPSFKPPKPSSLQRKERESDALRANLIRRKEQRRARKNTSPASPVSHP